MYTIEAHFLKPGAYGGSVRVWGNAWDVFRRTPSRGGRGRRAAVECFECGGISFFFFRSLYFECTRPAASMRPLCLIYLSNSNEARPRERSDRRSFFSYRQKSLFIMRPFFVFRQKVSSYPGTYRVPLFNLSVCVSVSVYV